MQHISYEELDDFLREFRRAEYHLNEGMQKLIEYCRQHYPDTDWSPFETLDYTADVVAISHWLAKTLITDPPPDAIKGLSFGLCEPVYDIEDKWVVGLDVHLMGDKDIEDSGKYCDWVCRGGDYFATGYSGSWILFQIFQLSDERSSRNLSEERGGYLSIHILSLGYLGMAIRDICQTLDKSLLLGSQLYRAITIGFDEGRFVMLGYITKDGWKDAEY